jgi:type IV secretory pathway VirJ component
VITLLALLRPNFLDVAVLMLALLAVGCRPAPPTVDGGILGPLNVFAPDDSPVGLVFLVSDALGWSRQLTRAAERLSERGMIAVGVDTPRMLANLRSDTEPCHQLAEAFETASQAIQKQAKLDVYFLPILAGVKEGAVLALAGLWQAGPETFAGAATVDFSPALAGAAPLCADPAALQSPDGKAFVYLPPSQLFGWWQAAWTAAPEVPVAEFARLAGASTPPLEADGGAPIPPVRLLLDTLAWGSGERWRDAEEVLKLGDLPVVDLPGRAGARKVAIIFSGEGGWRDLDRSLGEILAAGGVHVIGIDCLRYFWSEKAPEKVAQDLSALIDDLAERIAEPRIALIGFSFGADVLPAVFNRLPPEDQARVVLISLLAPGHDAHFEIHVSAWLGVDSGEDGVPVAAELARIDPGRVQCIYGRDEAADTGCLDPAVGAAEIVGIPGGHRFDDDYAALAQRILKRMSGGA